jgi:hypothetical protein
MTKQRVLAPAVLLLAAAVAACGGTTASPGAASPSGPSPDVSSPAASDAASPSAATSPDAGASGSPDASASAAASADASASAGASAATSPDTAGGGGTGGDLAASIPTTVGDIAMSTTEVDPATFIATNVNLQLTPILTALGRTAADLEVVSASGAGVTSNLFIEAVRIQGADATALSTAFEAAATAAPGNTVETGEVGGKSVVTVTTGSYTMSAYATGDTMYFVRSSDAALVEEGITALP